MRKLLRYSTLWILSKIYRSIVPTILMYHSISNSNNVFFTVRPEMFERQLEFLKKNKYRFVSIEEVEDFYVKGETLPEKAVCITFDDGYLDNLTEALPIIEKYNAPAIIYVATKYVINEKSDKDIPICNVEQIKNLSQHPLITIGAHTHSHLKLSALDPDEAYKEIISGKELLQSWTGKEIKHFAYPKGDFCKETIKLVEKVGISTAVTVVPGYIGHGGRYEIGRIPVDKSMPIWLFKVCCRKFMTVYSGWREMIYR